MRTLLNFLGALLGIQKIPKLSMRCYSDALLLVLLMMLLMMMTIIWAIRLVIDLPSFRATWRLLKLSANHLKDLGYVIISWSCNSVPSSIIFFFFFFSCRIQKKINSAVDEEAEWETLIGAELNWRLRIATGEQIRRRQEQQEEQQSARNDKDINQNKVLFEEGGRHVAHHWISRLAAL